MCDIQDAHIGFTRRPPQFFEHRKRGIRARKVDTAVHEGAHAVPANNKPISSEIS
ncbi:hypothetical protein RA8CHR_01179 [Variovorax sp. RA8]|nr:hypothetical protein RA8CHR_01179 [Variovorax sp. RA8]